MPNGNPPKVAPMNSAAGGLWTRGRRFVVRELHSGPGLVALATAGLSAIALMVAMRSGAGVSYDTVAYVSSGLNLAAGKGLVYLNGIGHTSPMVWYPPAFPLEFTFGHFVGLNYQRTDRLVSSVEVACLVWLTYVMLARHLRRRSWVVAGTVLVGAATPIFAIYEWILSETGFVLVCLAFVLALEKLIERPSSRGWLAGAVVLAWGGYLFRYLGVALIVAGGAGLLVGLWRRGWRKAIFTSATFGVLALIVPVGWSIRNYAVSGTIAGSRAAKSGAIGFLFTRMLDTLNAWLWPTIDSLKSENGNGEIVQHPLLEAVVLLVAFGALATVGYLAWKRRVHKLDPPYGSSLVAICMLPLSYICVLIYGKTHSDAGIGANNRYLLPIFVPLLILALVCLERLVDVTPGRLRTTAGRSALALLSCGAVVQGFWTWKLVDQSFDFGIGYSRPTWEFGHFAQFAKSLPNGPPEASNVPWAMWMIDPQTIIPTLSVRRAEFSTKFVRQLACDHAYLFWVPWPTRQAPALAPIQQMGVLTQVGSFPWGQIYVMAPPAGSTYCSA
jgi:hypothetical protein